MEQVFDLLVSDSQIRLRSKRYVDDDHQWGPGNVEQGFLLHDGLIVADPLVEDTIGANVIVRLSDEFSPDANSQRAAKINFNVLDPDLLTVSSAAEEFSVHLPVAAGRCTVIYEVCLGDEVYYVFTFLPELSEKSLSLMEDGWGLANGQELIEGKF